MVIDEITKRLFLWAMIFFVLGTVIKITVYLSR